MFCVIQNRQHYIIYNFFYKNIWLDSLTLHTEIVEEQLFKQS